MSDVNFMRRYILTAGIEGQTGLQIGHIDNARQTALHVSFSVEKSDSDSSNEAKVQIWNLSDESLKILEQKNCKVELRAGYGNNISLILVGEISHYTTTLDNADRLTELSVVDGLKSTQDTQISMSYSGKVNTYNLYTKVAKEMGLAIVFGDGVDFKSMSSGFSFVGKAKSALGKIADYNGHSWTIQNEVIQIYKKGNGVSNLGYLISKETGLVGMPKRVKIGSDDSSEIGWEINYLLNGAIGVNDVIRLESKMVTGDFKINKVTIGGDNLSGEWMCTAQVVECTKTSTTTKATTAKKINATNAMTIQHNKYITTELM